MGVLLVLIWLAMAAYIVVFALHMLGTAIGACWRWMSHHTPPEPTQIAPVRAPLTAMERQRRRSALLAARSKAA
jgi:hypothetical protein